MTDNPIPGLPGRFLRKLGDMMSAKAEGAFRTKDTETLQAAMHHYDVAQERPARRLMEDLQRHDNGGPGWRDKLSNTLPPKERAAWLEKIGQEGKAGAEHRANQAELAREIEKPTPRRSMWADDMREAEKAALQVAATENTHDHTQGRER